MKNSLTITASFFLTSSIAFAAPTVTDNTISWPDDGWYQVQSADTYESICGGTSFCVVEPGVYNVINHTTGERFENILVGQLDNAASPITVTGNTISWPNDGWYQVQRAEDYQTLCNGGSSCVVPNGLFNVINHTTRERFTNVLVSGGAGLNSFGDSEAFYSALRDALINNANNDVFRVSESVDFDGVPVSSVPSDGDFSADADVGALANDVTSTNVQELGVDEQDRVKVNSGGTQLFVLSTENTFFAEPDILFIDDQPLIDEAMPVEPSIIIAPAPPALPGIAVSPPPVDSVELEPIDLEDIIEDEDLRIALPFPEEQVTTLRILALDPATPDATSINDIKVDLKGRNADGFYLYENDGNTSAIITASGGGYWDVWARPAAFSGRQSLIAKVDVTDAANASVSEMLTIEGQIVSSRRIGDSLFFASRYYPSLPWAENPTLWRETVETSDLAALMPTISKSGSDESTPLVNASACFVATGIADDPYYSPDIITLGVIDLPSMTLRDSQCYLGATETLYANSESVFLATTRYDYSGGPQTTDGLVVDTSVNLFDADQVWFDPRQTTDIHQFDITSDKLSYAGSGSVPGHLGWNSFQKPYRMSEKDGYLRIATMNDQQGPDQSPILLNILKSDGQGNLTSVSSLPNESRPEHIGKPGERLYASRFVGDRAYLVTFRQTDPLYLVDLSDPKDPEVTGELEIQGYSDYLTPVGDTHLLGIGKDAIAAGGPGDGRGAWVQGIKLALFDVSDPSAPAEVESVLLGERGTDSVALSNPRAITIQAANDQHPMRVSFGANVHGTAFPTTSPTPEQARGYVNWSYTGLHGFDVTGGDNASITPRGALIVDRNNGDRRSQNYWDDRSVMVNDAVFYVNGTDVYPALWDDLANVPRPR